MIAGWPIKLCTLGGVLSISFGTRFVHFVHVIMTVNLFVSHPVKSDKVTHTIVHTYIGCLNIFSFIGVGSPTITLSFPIKCNTNFFED